MMYLANHTRPDISYAVNLLCRFLTKPTQQLYMLAKRILRYLNGTRQMSLEYRRPDGPMNMEIYANADFGNILHENKSISGLACMFGGCLIDWSSRKQKTVSTSTCELEGNLILNAVNEAEYLHELLSELGYRERVGQPIIVYNDNQSANISVTGCRFQANRHYCHRLGRIREAILNGLIELRYTPTEMMKADLFTKSFTKARPAVLRDLIALS